MQLQFLDKPMACQWVRCHHQSYMQSTLQCPTNRRVRSYDSSQAFCAKLVGWSEAHTRALTAVVASLQARCWTWRPFLSRLPWTFLQVRNDVDGGMPHTIHTAIVLPTQLVEALAAAAHPHSHPVDSASRRAIETLVHERMHVLQKAHPQRFRLLYDRWGFAPVRPHTAVAALVSRIHATRAERTNPDTPQRYVLRGRWYPFVHLDPRASTLHDATYYLVDLVAYRSNPANGWYLMSDVAWYNDYYGGTDHCYHPDESAAVLLAEAICHDYDHSAAAAAAVPPAPSPAALALQQWSHTFATQPVAVMGFT
jgi:hypothetical protein